MKLPATEDRDPQSVGLSKKSDEDVLSLLLDRQITALNAAARAIPQISQAAAALLRAARDGGKIGYAGAGSAGLTALADCLELPGTFGFPPSACAFFMPAAPKTSCIWRESMRMTRMAAPGISTNPASEKAIY
ncbi:hypothetical protein [Roseibium salinum]|uniref:N-acetylmuramic acid 6-phosphate etherase n=1 Tax=Roseibium salinum TaxID=1604349 RepID=A0ABT3R122_9HYPH|nr:hypothetical protein [Roseibium sp. DSM 29163]MCX2722860.1 hypothetical protein [Roseibium sp. DSM 29163]